MMMSKLFIALFATATARQLFNDKWLTDGLTKPDHKAKIKVQLSEAGYQEIVALHSDNAMTAFVKGLLAKEGKTITDLGELNGVVPWFSGTRASQSLEELKTELASKSWIVPSVPEAAQAESAAPEQATEAVVEQKAEEPPQAPVEEAPVAKAPVEETPVQQQAAAQRASAQWAGEPEDPLVLQASTEPIQFQALANGATSCAGTCYKKSLKRLKNKRLVADACGLSACAACAECTESETVLAKTEQKDTKLEQWEQKEAELEKKEQEEMKEQKENRKDRKHKHGKKADKLDEEKEKPVAKEEQPVVEEKKAIEQEASTLDAKANKHEKHEKAVSPKEKRVETAEKAVEPKEEKAVDASVHEAEKAQKGFEKHERADKQEAKKEEAAAQNEKAVEKDTNKDENANKIVKAVQVEAESKPAHEENKTEPAIPFRTSDKTEQEADKEESKQMKEAARNPGAAVADKANEIGGAVKDVLSKFKHFFSPSPATEETKDAKALELKEQVATETGAAVKLEQFTAQYTEDNASTQSSESPQVALVSSTKLSESKVSQQQSTVSFQPGTLGMRVDWSRGKVMKLEKGDTQSNRNGVQVGWVMTKVDGAPFSEQLLEVKSRGAKEYSVTFAKNPADADKQTLGLVQNPPVQVKAQSVTEEVEPKEDILEAAKHAQKAVQQEEQLKETKAEKAQKSHQHHSKQTQLPAHKEESAAPAPAKDELDQLLPDLDTFLSGPTNVASSLSEKIDSLRTHLKATKTADHEAMQQKKAELDSSLTQAHKKTLFMTKTNKELKIEVDKLVAENKEQRAKANKLRKQAADLQKQLLGVRGNLSTAHDFLSNSLAVDDHLKNTTKILEQLKQEDADAQLQADHEASVTAVSKGLGLLQLSGKPAKKSAEEPAESDDFVGTLEVGFDTLATEEEASENALQEKYDVALAKESAAQEKLEATQEGLLTQKANAVKLGERLRAAASQLEESVDYLQQRVKALKNFAVAMGHRGSQGETDGEASKHHGKA